MIQRIPGSRALGVVAHRVGGKVLEFGQRFQPSVSASDEDVGKEFFRSCRSSVLALFEGFDQVIAQEDRIGQLLKPTACSAQAGDRQKREIEPGASTRWS